MGIKKLSAKIRLPRPAHTYTHIAQVLLLITVDVEPR